MGNRYINDIILQYEKDRTKAEDAARERRLEVYKSFPRVKQIDSELGLIGIDIAKAIFAGNIDIKKYIKDKKKHSIDLKMEKAEILSRAGLTIDYDSPKYKCSDCNDTGYIGTEKCHCFKQKIIDKYYDQSNLKNILKKENFDMFVFDYYSPHKFEDESLSPRKNIEGIFKTCIDFVSSFDKSNQNLFFYGKSGLGKTFLSNCIAKDLLDKGKLVIYQTASSLVDILKDATFDNENRLAKERADDIFDCDLLIIDDLGTEYIANFSQTELFNIINKRLISNKKMIVSTNLSLDNLFKTYSERITSRIIGNFTVCKFYGEDIRYKIGEQKRKNVKI